MIDCETTSRTVIPCLHNARYDTVRHLDLTDEVPGDTVAHVAIMLAQCKMVLADVAPRAWILRRAAIQP